MRFHDTVTLARAYRVPVYLKEFPRSHAVITFAEEISGPVAIGANRHIETQAIMGLCASAKAGLRARKTFSVLTAIMRTETSAWSHFGIKVFQVHSIFSACIRGLITMFVYRYPWLRPAVSQVVAYVRPCFRRCAFGRL